MANPFNADERRRMIDYHSEALTNSRSAAGSGWPRVVHHPAALAGPNPAASALEVLVVGEITLDTTAAIDAKLNEVAHWFLHDAENRRSWASRE